MQKHRGFKKENSSRVATANDLCHKYGKPWHFIRYCLIHKMEYKIKLRIEATNTSQEISSLTRKAKNLL